MDNTAEKIDLVGNIKKPFQQVEKYKNPTVVKMFMPIEEIKERTGLSAFYIRQGIKDGWIPHIRCGNKAMINYPKLLQILDDESVKN